MIIERNDKMHSIHLDSTAQLLEQKIPSRHDNNVKRWHKNFDGGSAWGGSATATFDSVMEKAKNGDVELLEKMKSKQREFIKAVPMTLRAEVESKIRKLVWKDQGDEIDIHRVYCGQLDTAWRGQGTTPKEKREKYVHMLIDLQGHCAINAVDSFWRTAVATYIYQKLEAAGYRTKITVCAISTNRYDQYEGVTTNSIDIKGYDQKVNPAKLAAMSHLGFYRSALFLTGALEDWDIKVGNGRPMNLTLSNLPIQVKRTVDNGDVKPIIIESSTSLRGAIDNLKSIAEALK